MVSTERELNAANASEWKWERNRRDEKSVSNYGMSCGGPACGVTGSTERHAMHDRGRGGRDGSVSSWVYRPCMQFYSNQGEAGIVQAGWFFSARSLNAR